MKYLSQHARVVLAIVLAILGGGIAITVASDDGGNTSVTVTLGGPQPGTQTVEVPRPALDQAGDVDDHDGLRSENPAGVPSQQLDAGREQQERLAANDQLPIVTPDAAPSQRGCRTQLVRNYSSRRGVRPRLLVLHYTVSPNRLGWDDVNSIVALFDRSAFAASSNYVIDAEGNCAYIVRESDKAWTQAAANPVSISVEQINTGSEKTYAGTAGLAKIGVVFADAAKRWDIPIQRGAVSGCTVTRPGIIDHKSLGACGGGHHDISPYGVDQVIAAVERAGGAGPPSAAARRQCQELNRLRKTGQRGSDRARLLKRNLTSHRYVCTPGTGGKSGSVRRG